jgi:hypothetical protein
MMNDRIKQLASRCRIETYGVNGELLYEGFDEEKFAELIVRECADACYDHKDVESFGIYPVRVAMVTKACSDNIKKHFGVGE